MRVRAGHEKRTVHWDQIAATVAARLREDDDAAVPAAGQGIGDLTVRR